MKNHFRHLHAPLCVIFAPNSGYIARYVPFIWHKSPTNCDAHLTESIFQTSPSGGSTGSSDKSKLADRTGIERRWEYVSSINGAHGAGDQ